MPGKTPMWGNLMRERERERERFYYSASGKYISATNSQFLAKTKYLTAPKLSPTNYALKNMPNLYGCTAHPEKKTLKNVPIVCCTIDQYGPATPTKHSKQPQFLCQQVSSKIMLFFLVVWTIQIHIVRPPTAANDISPHTKFSLGICAHFVLGNVHSKLPTFLSQSLS
jgi:hypothetical protein